MTVTREQIQVALDAFNKWLETPTNGVPPVSRQLARHRTAIRTVLQSALYGMEDTPAPSAITKAEAVECLNYLIDMRKRQAYSGMVMANFFGRWHDLIKRLLEAAAQQGE
jgi:hypothetical protein